MRSEPFDLALQALTRALRGAGVSHVFVGEVAMAAHGAAVAAGGGQAIEFCATRPHLTRFRDEVACREFDFLGGSSLRCVHPASQTLIVAHESGAEVSSAFLGGVRWPDSAVAITIDNLPVTPLATLVELLLAGADGGNANRVGDLIAAQGLTEPFAEQLAPSVRGAFLSLLSQW